MPGGQSASAFGASLEVLERSTGTSTSIFAAGLGFGAAGTGFGIMAGFTDEMEAGACCCILVRRMLSMEKLRFLAG